MSVCMHCKHESPKEHYERIVNNKTPLFGDFTGWRMAGRELVAPNGGRLNVRRLEAIAWAEKRERMERKKRMTQPNPPTSNVVTLPAREKFEGYA